VHQCEPKIIIALRTKTENEFSFLDITLTINIYYCNSAYAYNLPELAQSFLQIHATNLEKRTIRYFINKTLPFRNKQK
jgi:hypothetical protein